MPGLDKLDRRPCCVYRWYAATGRLLYVGASLDPDRRWKQARWASEWTRFATRRTVEWHSCVGDALAAEWTAIQSEDPLFNLLGTPGYVAPDICTPIADRVLDLGDGTSVRFEWRRRRAWRLVADVELIRQA